MFAGFLYIRLSLGKILGSVKDNVLVIITHLSGTGRGKLDTNLIKQMSPNSIQEAGYKLLNESKFTQIFKDNTKEFFKCVDEKKPLTRLDVENYSILCYNIILNHNFMMPVKTYLYNNPDIRDTYPVLAGVYIRDMYLKEHREIVQ